MRLLNLEEKRCSLSKALSGGMKRKLSIGIALIGDSKASGSLRPGGPVEPGGWSASEGAPWQSSWSRAPPAPPPGGALVISGAQGGCVIQGL